MTIDINSKAAQLDLLLEFVCEDLQLTQTQHDRARSAYETIAGLLGDPDGVVAEFDPDVYAQGSNALGTTNRPREGEEFDVDLVCELRSFKGGEPPPRDEVISLIASQLRSDGTYAPRVKVRERCVRVEYAGEFHVDVVPAVPGPLPCNWGETAIKIPDRTERCWVGTNPMGHKHWFFSQAQAGTALIKEARATISPFPPRVDSADKAVLQKEAQLFKRRRDVQFEEKPEFGPKSILLTTLNGMVYRGERSLLLSTEQCLEALASQYARRELASRPPAVSNPSNPSENLARHWSDRDLFIAFCDYVEEFRAGMVALREAEGLHEIALVLKRLFDPGDRGVVTSAVRRYTEQFQNARSEGAIKLDRTGSTLVTGTSALSVPSNSFFGD